MSAKLNQLISTLQATLAEKITKQVLALGEVTIECAAADYLLVCQTLRDGAGLKFEQLIDLCGVDYQDYGNGGFDGSRYAVVSHFLSVTLNHRVRLRVFAQDEEFPILPTLVDLWPVANWFEREAFDLYGIMFENHPDLRRLLTDYGFVGHPFRKDFPMIGSVEMRYDPEQKRVIYQPVTIDERNNVPRVIRSEGAHHG
ncbi:NADH-quinone oxidoreductase subunit C 1 [mine drainage metagenome]|uniref:NADH-quinone oxidoreductase subunit C 1 n=1 Tax=mine drainage metagenome TaxID=410659 RepID=A0A1J5RL29_9ZZZZ